MARASSDFAVRAAAPGKTTLLVDAPFDDGSLRQGIYGEGTDIGDNELASSIPDVPVAGTVAQIAAGGRHICVLLEGGAVRCWGKNASGQLGYANTEYIGDDESPASAGDVDVGPGKVRQLALGDYYTCALFEGGALRCWGSNYEGRLGYGNDLRIGDDETPASAGDVQY